MDGKEEKWEMELLTPSGSLRTMQEQSCPWWVGRSSTHVAWPLPQLLLDLLKLGKATDLLPPYC